MDALPDILHFWLLNYGSLALFVLLALGIVALPVPEETLLLFSGFMIHKGVFAFLPTLLAAFFGSVIGISLSYLIGSTGGLYLVKNYGSYVGMTEHKLNKVHSWFEHYGRWIVFGGYFVPGLRHFTGIVAGISTLKYHDFALFAYTGAFFWVSLFIGLGYIFGDYHQALLEFIEQNIELTLFALILVLIIFGLIHKYLLTRNKKD